MMSIMLHLKCENLPPNTCSNYWSSVVTSSQVGSSKDKFSEDLRPVSIRFGVDDSVSDCTHTRNVFLSVCVCVCACV